MDPGSEIRKKIIPDPWGKKAPDPRSRIRIRNTGKIDGQSQVQNLILGLGSGFDSNVGSKVCTTAADPG
jgi:hypothetical protein